MQEALLKMLLTVGDESVAATLARLLTQALPLLLG